MTHVFCGTSEFAATVLRGLDDGPFRPALVVTPPDRRRGRGRRVSPPPAAAAAVELGLDLFQTSDINAQESLAALRDLAPDAATVCAFGQLIAEPLISELPMLNIHPSLLPRWRGAAPIERAVMAGDERTGVCVMKLTAGLDSGPVAAVEEVAISPDDDYGKLSARLATIGSSLLSGALRELAAGTLELTEQPEDGVTYAEKIEASDRRVDPESDSRTEALRIRALTPHIGAWVTLPDGGRLGVRKPIADPGQGQAPAPGTFGASDDGQQLTLGLREGMLLIGVVQPEGKRWMPAADFLRGYGVPGADTAADG